MGLTGFKQIFRNYVLVCCYVKMNKILFSFLFIAWGLWFSWNLDTHQTYIGGFYSFRWNFSGRRETNSVIQLKTVSVSVFGHNKQNHCRILARLSCYSLWLGQKHMPQVTLLLIKLKVFKGGYAKRTVWINVVDFKIIVLFPECMRHPPCY